MKILFCGEAWGEREAAFHHAVVGPTGRELARMAAIVGLAPPLAVPHPDERAMIRHWAMCREHGIGVTNVFNAHPPNNRIEHFFVGRAESRGTEMPALRSGKYINPEHMHHVLRLWEEVASAKPNLVVALGNSALWAMVQISGIGNFRGAVDQSPNLGTKVLPTYHPAAVLRQWSLRTIVLCDLQKARIEAEFPEIRRRERWITTLDPSPRGIATAHEWLSRPAEIYAHDIETERGQISMASFARTPEDALVIQFIDPESPGRNYWSTAELEAAALRVYMRGLRTPVPKVHQNGLYDMSYNLRYGIFPTKPHHDTMLRAHAHTIELQKSLGFLGSVWAGTKDGTYVGPGEVAWKVMRKEKGTELKRDE
jgi:uracil-DNA glycosylase